MSVLLPTTSITVRRHPKSADPLSTDETPPVTVLSGLKAAIYGPGGGVSHAEPGSSSIQSVSLTSDPADIRVGDEILDERTGDVYIVSSEPFHYTGPGHFIQSTAATMQMVQRGI